MQYIFTYGTLKRGYRNHKYIEKAKFISDASIEGFYMFDLGRYPGIYEGAGIIYGEIYEIDDDNNTRYGGYISPVPHPAGGADPDPPEWADGAWPDTFRHPGPVL